MSVRNDDTISDEHGTAERGDEVAAGNNGADGDGDERVTTSANTSFEFIPPLTEPPTGLSEEEMAE